MNNKTMEQKLKRIGKFITWWVVIWYNLFPIIFFGSWGIYSYVIARLMPKANGQPHEDAGMLFGIILSCFTLCLTKFIHDKMFEKMWHKFK